MLPLIVYRDESVRDSFITGLQSSYIRQRLLEYESLTFQEAFDKARSLESAQLQADTYQGSKSSVVAATGASSSSNSVAFGGDLALVQSHTCASSLNKVPHETGTSTATKNTFVGGEDGSNLNSMQGSKCWFCGNSRHPRSRCPAKDAICNKCHKTGHYSRVCQSSKNRSTTAAIPCCLPWLPEPTLVVYQKL